MHFGSAYWPQGIWPALMQLGAAHESQHRSDGGNFGNLGLSWAKWGGILAQHRGAGIDFWRSGALLRDLGRRAGPSTAVLRVIWEIWGALLHFGPAYWPQHRGAGINFWRFGALLCNLGLHVHPSAAVMVVILEIWGSLARFGIACWSQHRGDGSDFGICGALGQNGAAHWSSTAVLASTFGDLARSCAILGGMLVPAQRC